MKFQMFLKKNVTEYLTLFLSYFGCLLFCVQISNPIVNYENQFSGNIRKQCYFGVLSGVFSGAAPLRKVSWSVECTLQNTPNFLARAAPENTPKFSGVSNCLLDTHNINSSPHRKPHVSPYKIEFYAFLEPLYTNTYVLLNTVVHQRCF